MLERVDAEGEAGDAIDLVLAETGDQNPEHARDQAFEQILVGQAGGDSQRKRDQREKIPRSELKPDAGELRCQHGQQNGTEQSAEEG